MPFVDNDLLSSLGETLLVFEHLFDTGYRGVSRRVAIASPPHCSPSHVFGNRLLKHPRSWKPKAMLQDSSTSHPRSVTGNAGNHRNGFQKRNAWTRRVARSQARHPAHHHCHSSPDPIPTPVPADKSPKMGASRHKCRNVCRNNCLGGGCMQKRRGWLEMSAESAVGQRSHYFLGPPRPAP